VKDHTHSNFNVNHEHPHSSYSSKKYEQNAFEGGNHYSKSLSN